jgi:hypothetical protein
MDDTKISNLGKAAFSRSVHPLKRDRVSQSTIVGFDTEYVSKEPDGKPSELISFQLHTGEKGVFVPVLRGKKLTLRWLLHEVTKLTGARVRDVTLVTFFSLAELQFLPLVTRGWNIREYSRGSTDVSFTIGGCALHVFDLFRWFDGKSLAKAADALGLAKGEYDTSKVTRACLRDARFRSYALHDAYLCVEILARLRKTFLDKVGIDPVIAKTPASASASAYRKVYVTRKLYCDRNDVRLLTLRSAWGGRAEAFRRGELKGTWTEYDFVSAYPTAAERIGEFPVQKSWRRIRSMREAEQCRGGFAYARFQFPSKEVYPCLPVWSGKETVYPLSGTTHCSLYELSAARRAGADIRLLEAYGYAAGDPSPADYLRWTMEQRRGSTGAARVMWKLLGNSLTGKFAQSLAKIPIDEYRRLADLYDVNLDDLMCLTSDELYALGASKVVSVGAVFMPEWYGLITGYCRAAIGELVRSGMAAYCHTDSVWTQRKPKGKMLPFDEKLSGPCKIVRSRLACLGGNPTPERIKSEKVHAPHHAIDTLDATCDIMRRFNGDTFVHEYTRKRPLHVKEAIKTGRTPGAWVKETKQACTHWDCKRRLLPDGTTLPWGSVEEFRVAQKEG